MFQEYILYACVLHKSPCLRIVAPFRLEGSWGRHLAQPVHQREGKLWRKTILLKALCTQVLKTSKEGNSTTPLGSLFQCLIIHTVYLFFFPHGSCFPMPLVHLERPVSIFDCCLLFFPIVHLDGEPGLAFLITCSQVLKSAVRFLSNCKPS